MRVNVLLFARARDLAGRDALVIELPPAACVGDLRRALASRIPPLAGLLERSALAVNNEFAEDAQPLAADDEVALLPPVSGGSGQSAGGTPGTNAAKRPREVAGSGSAL